MLSLGFFGGPNPLGHRTYMGIIYWLPFSCQEQREGTGGGKSWYQPPKDVYDTHCDAGIDYLSKSSILNMGITSKRELHEAVNINEPVKWTRS